MTLLLYADVVLLLGSLLLFTISVFSGRRQKVGLLLSAMAVMFFVLYYSDRSPFGTARLRNLLNPFKLVGHGNPHFVSSFVPAYLIAALYLIRILVFHRIASRRIPPKVKDRSATFLAGASLAILIEGLIDSVYGWGWVGAVILTTILAFVYLGTVGIFRELFKFVDAAWNVFVAWVKRIVARVAGEFIRLVYWFASLPRRLAPDMQKATDRLNQVAEAQDSKRRDETDKVDEKLQEAAQRD